MESKSIAELLELIRQELFSMNIRMEALEQQFPQLAATKEAVEGLTSEISGFRVALGEFHSDVEHQKEQTGEQLERGREERRALRHDVTALQRSHEGIAKDVTGLAADVDGIKISLATNVRAPG